MWTTALQRMSNFMSSLMYPWTCSLIISYVEWPSSGKRVKTVLSRWLTSLTYICCLCWLYSLIPAAGVAQGSVCNRGEKTQSQHSVIAPTTEHSGLVTGAKYEIFSPKSSFLNIFASSVYAKIVGALILSWVAWAITLTLLVPLCSVTQQGWRWRKQMSQCCGCWQERLCPGGPGCSLSHC